MKRFLTLLTLSFLSTSTLAKAGNFNILELPTTPEKRTASLRAKADRLQRKIDNTENADLKQSLTQQREVVNTLLHIPLTEFTEITEQYWLYDSAKNKKDEINARIYTPFLHEMRQGNTRSQFNKIYRTLRTEIYAPESQESRDLDAAIRAFGGTFGEEVSKDTLKAAERYLKMQRLIAPHIQTADKIIEEYMANAGRIEADFNRIKESGDERDLKILEHWLPYESDGGRIVRQALGRLSSIGTSLVPESDPKHQYPPMYRAEYREHQIYDILGYKALEDKLAPILGLYRQSRHDAPDFIASVFSGASEYAKLEAGLFSRYGYYSADTPREVQEFLGIMGKIRQLPFLLTTLKELQPKAQEELLRAREKLSLDRKFVGHDVSSGYQSFVQIPGEVSEQETSSFIYSIFSGESDYAKLEEGLGWHYGGHSFGTPPEVRNFLGIMKEIREVPILLTILSELRPKAQEILSISGGGGDVAPDLDFSSAAVSSSHHVPTTFRTAGANDAAEIKHSAVYASFRYQNKPDAVYSLIINHRTKDKGSEVRVFNPNTKTYIDLGRLSPSMGFSDQVFNLSSLFASAPSSSSGPSIMKTELNFIDGISDIHSFTIKSGEERLMEVILGDEGSEKQTGVYVYAPELAGKLQEWSEKKSNEKE
jgi:hypothetical protein